MRACAALLILMASAPAASAQVAPDDALALVERVIDTAILPAHDRLVAATGDLADTIGRLCRTPSDGALADARTAFAATAAAWGGAEFFRFGPVTEDRRLERFHFWPDVKGIGLRQVQGLLAREDATATDPANLAGKSVAVQGLPALEFILHGSGAEALAGGAPYRCRYAAAVADNLAGIAGALAAAWRDPDGYRRVWLEPGDGNPVYRTAAESLQEFAEIFTNGFLIMAEQKLEPALGASIDKANGRLVELRRSALSADMLQADRAGLSELLARSKVSELLAGDINTEWIVPALQFQMEEVRTKLDEIPIPLSEAVADPAFRGKLEYVVIVLKSLGQLSADRLAGSLGLQVGFNALDGD